MAAENLKIEPPDKLCRYPNTRKLDLYQPGAIFPEPSSFSVYYPEAKISHQMVEAIKRLGGSSLSFGFWYGSRSNGESSMSRFDFLLLVEDPEQFYQEAIPARRSDFGSDSIQRNVEWNRSGLNFYRTDLDLGDKIVPAKYGVVSRRLAQDHMLGVKPGSVELPGIPAGEQIAISGRFQKTLAEVVAADSLRPELAKAINHTRIAGAWISLGQLPEDFGLQDFKEVNVNNSYHADVRPERFRKHKIIVRVSPADYDKKDRQLLVKLEESGVVIQIDPNTYHSIYAPRFIQVLAWFLSGKKAAFKTNYGKHTRTGNMATAFSYGLEKASKALSFG